MNKFLEKIAKDLPYRDRVEVVIQKDDKILLTKNKNKETNEEWYGFPGGGVDDQTEKLACENECLEEVGVAIKNIKPIGDSFKEEGGLGKKEDRHLKFRGSLTKWFTADFYSMDKSKMGDDGDSRKYTWLSHEEALEAVKGDRGIATHRHKVLKALKPVKSV